MIKNKNRNTNSGFDGYIANITEAEKKVLKDTGFATNDDVNDIKKEVLEPIDYDTTTAEFTVETKPIATAVLVPQITIENVQVEVQKKSVVDATKQLNANNMQFTSFRDAVLLYASQMPAAFASLDTKINETDATVRNVSITADDALQTARFATEKTRALQEDMYSRYGIDNQANIQRLYNGERPRNPIPGQIFCEITTTEDESNTDVSQQYYVYLNDDWKVIDFAADYFKILPTYNHKVLATNSDTTQTALDYNTDAKAHSLVLRDEMGSFSVNPPTKATNPATKEYVDTKVAAMQKYLHHVTLVFNTDGIGGSCTMTILTNTIDAFTVDTLSQYLIDNGQAGANGTYMIESNKFGNITTISATADNFTITMPVTFTIDAGTTSMSADSTNVDIAKTSVTISDIVKQIFDIQEQ